MINEQNHFRVSPYGHRRVMYSTSQNSTSAWNQTIRRFRWFLL